MMFSGGDDASDEFLKKSLDSNDASDDVFKQRLVCGFYLDVEKVSVSGKSLFSSLMTKFVQRSKPKNVNRLLCTKFNFFSFLNLPFVYVCVIFLNAKIRKN